MDLGSTRVQVIDVPGAYSLYPTSKDERIVVRQFLYPDQHPDLVLYVADISQLEKQMLLLTQIRDLGYPMILALNMTDVPGVTIQAKALEEHLKMPVVLVSGKTGVGIAALKMQLAGMINDRPIISESYYKLGDLEKKIVDQVNTYLPHPTPYGTLLKAHHYEWLNGISTSIKNEVKEKLDKAGFNPIQYQIQETLRRYDRFTPVIKKALHLDKGSAGMKFTDQIDRYVMHPILGMVIFFFLMLLIFQAIFAWASGPMDFIEVMMGHFSDGVRNILPNGWIEDLICDGIIAGLTGIIVFVPQIAILFLLLGILEEIGYMVRVVSMFDLLLRKFGLNGRSIVALVAGGACAIPAIMSARNISNRKERLITILVTPFISCSARIPVYVILIGFAVPKGRLLGFEQQGLALMGLYAIGIFTALLAAYILKKIIRTSERSFLMIELPVYRSPSAKQLFYLVWGKVKSFVYGAGKIIMVISLFLWFLASFGPVTFPSETSSPGAIIETHPPLEKSFAGYLGKAIEPVIAPLGFDWKIGIALISSFAAREVFVGTMATIYSIEDDTDTANIRTRMAQDRHEVTGQLIYNPATTWSLLIFYALAMQCMSTLAIVKRETGSWKWPLIQFLMMTGLAYLVSWTVFHILQ